MSAGGHPAGVPTAGAAPAPAPAALAPAHDPALALAEAPIVATFGLDPGVRWAGLCALIRRGPALSLHAVTIELDPDPHPVAVAAILEALLSSRDAGAEVRLAYEWAPRAYGSTPATVSAVAHTRERMLRLLHEVERRCREADPPIPVKRLAPQVARGRIGCERVRAPDGTLRPVDDREVRAALERLLGPVLVARLATSHEADACAVALAALRAPAKGGAGKATADGEPKKRDRKGWRPSKEAVERRKAREKAQREAEIAAGLRPPPRPKLPPFEDRLRAVWPPGVPTLRQGEIARLMGMKPASVSEYLWQATRRGTLRHPSRGVYALPPRSLE